jgi:hypothetical protein
MNADTSLRTRSHPAQQQRFVGEGVAPPEEIRSDLCSHSPPLEVLKILLTFLPNHLGNRW